MGGRHGIYKSIDRSVDKLVNDNSVKARELNDYGVKEMLNRMIRQAVVDYRQALKVGNYTGVMREEQFFRSEWFKHICELDGEKIIEEVKSGIMEV